MSFRAVALAGFALTLLAALPAQGDGAGPDDAKIYPAEAAIPNSRVIRFTSAIDKEPYAIQVSIPLWPAPKGGYPVIYVLDGEFYFPEAAMASDMLSGKGAVVVGIGHDTLNDKSVVERYAPHKVGQALVVNGDAATDAFSVLRNHDFRWPAKPEHRAPAFVQAIIGKDDGDVDAFLQVIEKEIKPKVEAIAPIDRGNQALFGHSAGGLAVVRALFTEPTAFRAFIAASPALWYDGGAVLDGEKHFADDVSKGLAAPRILFTAGALEPHTADIPKSFIAALSPAQQAEIAPYAKMRSTAPSNSLGSRDLAARLRALHGKPDYKVDFQMIAGENHQSSAFVAVGRAIKFAFADK